MPDVYLEMRYKLEQAHEYGKTLVKEVGASFKETFGRSYSSIETIMCEDADIVLITSSSTTSPARLVLNKLRKKGMKVGLMKIRLFRPFPSEDVREALSGKQKAVVIDRNMSFGKGGIFADEIRGAISNDRKAPLVYGYVAGLGGRDITPDLVEEIVVEAYQSEEPKSLAVWKGLKP